MTAAVKRIQKRLAALTSPPSPCWRRDSLRGKSGEEDEDCAVSILLGIHFC
jgi:hypothetical protein